MDHQNDFRMLPGETLAGILARYEQVAARSEEIVAVVPRPVGEHPMPKAPWNEPGAVRSVRRVLTHVIAETAQRAGHADILRETLDGQKSNASGDGAPLDRAIVLTGAPIVHMPLVALRRDLADHDDS
ncbi:DUF664 domain-containing protein [Nonomuraea sp. NPDC052116]|uniref:mycothiol transferase n=1 Tax=Nonomuraea sp. NPDC052116 TaxID=3155665 RepID=UPI003435B4E9